MSSRRPGASRGPTRPGAYRRTTGASPSGRPSPRPQKPGKPAKTSKSTGSGKGEENKPRLKPKERVKRSIILGGDSGRARAVSLRLMSVVLMAVLAVIIVTPTLTNYLDQQQQIRELNRSVEEARAHIDSLENERLLWNDDEYVQAQARERLGYVKPGEVLYTVEDPEAGTAEDERNALAVELEYNRRAATPWFTTMWDSVSVAGYSSAGGSEIVDPTDPVSPGETGETE